MKGGIFMKNFEETYNIRHLIYQNDWAHVYKAINSITHDIVILKVLVNQSDNKDYIDKLIKEVDILKNMENTNSIAVNHISRYMEDGKTYYYIETEYFEGESLENILASKSLDSEQGVKIIKQAIEGLKEFHFKNKSYKNLNAKNIFINSEGLVKIDTLAYLEGKDLNLSGEEEAVEDFDDSEDIYSLGFILCQIILGKLDPNVLKYKKEIDDKYLVHMIEKATSKKSINQYHDLNDFLVDINSYLEFGGVSSKTKTDSEEVFVEDELLEDNSEYVSEDKKDKRPRRGKLIKSLSLCLVIIVALGITAKGISLFNKDDNKEKNNFTTPVEDPSIDEKQIDEEEQVDEVDSTFDENNTDNNMNDSSDINNVYSEDRNNINNSYNGSNSSNGNYNGIYNGNSNTGNSGNSGNNSHSNGNSGSNHNGNSGSSNGSSGSNSGNSGSNNGSSGSNSGNSGSSNGSSGSNSGNSGSNNGNSGSSNGSSGSNSGNSGSNNGSSGNNNGNVDTNPDGDGGIVTPEPEADPEL